MEDQTVSKKFVAKIKKLNWEEEKSPPIKKEVSKEELAKNIDATRKHKTSYNLTKEDQYNLEDVWHYLKRKGMKVSKSDVVSEAFRDIRKKYLAE
jgi:hypothetical protein